MPSQIVSLMTMLLVAGVANSALLSYNEYFNDKRGDLSTVACSDGFNGLLTQGYKTFGDLPSFPNVGGAPAVEGWNSKSCGSCWELKYTNPVTGHSKAMYMTAIDKGVGKFVASKRMMDELVGGNAVQYGTVEVVAKQVALAFCGF